MKNRKLAVIVAVDNKWGIGKEGNLAWHFPEDFAHFKRTTMGTACVMGRRTYDEIAKMREGKEELLPGRECFVLTSRSLDDTRVTAISTIEEVYEKTERDIFFIGGRSVFEYGLQKCDVVYLSRIDGDYGCDTFFPKEGLEAFSVGFTEQLGPKISLQTWIKNYV